MALRATSHGRQLRPVASVLAGNRSDRRVEELSGAIYHVHAKDTAFDEQKLALNGVLEPLPSDRPADRSWTFRSVAGGTRSRSGAIFAVALQEAGYDEALSIEHEGPVALPGGRAHRVAVRDPRRGGRWGGA